MHFGPSALTLFWDCVHPETWWQVKVPIYSSLNPHNNIRQRGKSCTFLPFVNLIFRWDRSPSTYPGQWVSGSVIDSFRLEIAIALLKTSHTNVLREDSSLYKRCKKKPVALEDLADSSCKAHRTFQTLLQPLQHLDAPAC